MIALQQHLESHAGSLVREAQAMVLVYTAHGSQATTLWQR